MHPRTTCACHPLTPQATSCHTSLPCPATGLSAAGAGAAGPVAVPNVIQVRGAAPPCVVGEPAAPECWGRVPQREVINRRYLTLLAKSLPLPPFPADNPGAEGDEAAGRGDCGGWRARALVWRPALL